MFRFVILLLLLVLSLCAELLAQVPQRTRTVVLSPEDNRIKLDLLTLPESVRISINDTLVPRDHFDYDAPSSTVIFHWPAEWTSLPVEAVIQWAYYPISIPESFLARYQLIPSDFLTDTTSFSNIGPTRFVPQNEGFSSRISTSGSITRGVIVGNSRDAGLESGLRFDIQGYLTETIYLSASLSDQNTIIQPDGSTQNLREFDQVIIRLNAPGLGVQLGDVDARLNRSEIARVQRRLQGAVVKTDYSTTGVNQAVLSVQRGTFRVMQFDGIDGIQGPYRLTGLNNEQFIIVVAGTERVYIDGRLLTRGDDHDYVIDYSIGEITFTGMRMIRSSHDIRVEFQYLSNSYNRTLLAAESDHKVTRNGRFTVGATFIDETDNLNFGEGGLLSEEEIDIIRNAGGDLARMRISSADSVGFRPDSPYILYTRIDTLIQGVPTVIYRHIPGDESGRYRVTFSRTGQGNGSYRRAASNVNGIIYEWVGAGNGDHEPFRQLSGPQQTRILAVRGGGELASGIRTHVEWAGSNRNVNRLARDMDGISGQMVRAGFQIDSTDVLSDRVMIRGNYEYKDAAFTFFDRVRHIEYNKLWGLESFTNSHENRIELGGEFRLFDETTITYDWQKLFRSDRKGMRHDLSIHTREESIPYLIADYGVLRSKGMNGTSRIELDEFEGSTGYVMQLGNTGILVGTDFYIESDQRYDQVLSDSVQLGFRYRELTPSLGLQIGSMTEIRFGYSVRDEMEVYSGRLQPTISLTSPQITLRHRIQESFTTDTRVSWQKVKPDEVYAERTGAGTVEGLAIRSSTGLNLFRNAFSNSILYDIATESRSLLQETYIEVGPEFGQFVWIDLNGDGVRQLDEFFPEQNPNEGTYIRQMLPTDEVSPVISLRGRWVLGLDLIRWFPDWRNGRWWEVFIANTTYNSRIEIRDQSQTDRLIDVYLLRRGALLNDDVSLSGSFQWVQDLHLLRRIPAWDIRLRVDDRTQLNRQVNGIERSEHHDRSVRVEYRFPEKISTSALFGLVKRKNESERFVGRNFQIEGWGYEQDVNYSTDDGSMLSIGLGFGRKSDVSGANAVSWQAKTEGNFYIRETMRLIYRVIYRNIEVDDFANQNILFELTDGSGNGGSWLWNGGFQWQNSDWVRTSLQYDGRTIRGRDAIQTLRLTITALF